jgi:hypothetical protein
VIDSLDFSLTPTVLHAVAAGAALPMYVALIARLAPLSGRNALQFLLGCLVMLILWIGLVIVWPGPRSPGRAEVCVGLMILGAESLFYLEVWSLLSRGYTLGLLVTLHRAHRPLDEEELARSYRGGSGLSWIMQHRVSGLIAGGLVREHDGMVVLTPVLGVAAARLYKFSIMVLGLQRTG